MRRGTAIVTAAALLAALVVLVEVVAPHARPRTAAAPAGRPTAMATATPTALPRAATRRGRPNIVFILMDDLSLELLRTMPEAQRLRAAGASYANAFVVDSLCCPSRAAILTGQAPHQTGVLTNTPNDPRHPIGGWEAFRAHGNIRKQFSVALQRSGYTTGFVGKYLNDYEPTRGSDGRLVAPPKVAGWTEWHALLGGGYGEWGYRSADLDRHGRLRVRNHRRFPLSSSVAKRDSTYATNVAADVAVDFIDRHEDDRSPYFLEVATYGVHAQIESAYPGQTSSFPPAFADATRPGRPRGGNCGTVRCGRLTLADLAGYDDPRDDNAPTYLHADGTTSPAPAWRTNPITLTPARALASYRDRARMAQSIDRLVGRVRRAVGKDTYIVLTSDNGFHLGQHQLDGGKGTPYDSDTRVPLVVTGPGVVPGERQQFVDNIDLAPIFERLAGVEPGRFVSGRSFARSLSQPDAPGARYAFFEHTYARTQPGEVDTGEGAGGTIDLIPSYIAVRSAHGLLARFDLDKDARTTDYAYELYRYDVPWEDRNVFAEDHDKPYARDLLRRLRQWDGCTPRECRAAAR